MMWKLLLMLLLVLCVCVTLLLCLLNGVRLFINHLRQTPAVKVQAALRRCCAALLIGLCVCTAFAWLTQAF